MLRIQKVQISKELDLVLKCCEKDDTLSLKSFLNIDHQRFLDLIETHKVSTQCYRHLHDLDLFIEGISSRLEILVSNNKLIQLQNTSEMIAINESFKKRSIDCIHFKGNLLSYELYDDPAERTSRDIDILIDKKDLKQSIQLLNELNYTTKTYYNSPKQFETIIRYFHHLEFYNEEKGVMVELHWKLSPKSNMRMEKQVWNKKQTLELLGSQFQVLDTHTQFEYLMVHGASHCFFRIQWLLDLHVFKKRFGEKLEKGIGFTNETSVISCKLTERLLQEYFNDNSPITNHSDKTNTRRINKLFTLSKERITQNIHPKKSYDFGSRWDRFIYNHKLNFLLQGWSGFFKGIFKRNIRPNNWRIYAFPDNLFFLNHLFSRFIWVIGLFKKRAD